MKTIIRLVVCVLLLTGWGLAALSLHVIRTPEEIPFTLVPKERLGVTDTYVDTRNWSVNDAAKHPILVQKLINIGKTDVLRHIVPESHAAANIQAASLSGADLSRQLIDAIRSTSRNDPSKAATAVQVTGGLLGWF